ncbi:MAG TPA: TonB-dependent receptor [Gemmatimonadaceae bacterium]|nr:TonB-dependent receptor [Gemmatimonadaceae bacterium]
MSRGALRRAGRVAIAAALVVASSRATAQETGCTRLDTVPEVPLQGWAPPLDRTVSIQARDVALRDVLDRIAATADVRLSYSPDLLPLERRVCVAFRDVPLGGALSELLGGTGVEARVVGSQQVVLAPLPGRAVPTVAPRTAVLEQVVVTGSAAGAPERPLSIGLTVLPGAELRRRVATGTTSGIVNGAVPGVWLWEQQPTALLAHYASIRGASSFGISYPKVYIDGIEMASPLLVSRIDPEMIERVEVIRGPQGAALYGTDAISGVVNIVTRTAGAPANGSRIAAHGSFGVAASDYVARPPVTQEYGASIRAGSAARAFTMGLTAGGTGAYVPGAWDRHLGATASTRVVGTKTIVTGTARLQLADAMTPGSPILLESVPLAIDRAERQTATQYTLGTTMRVMQSERMTHTLVLGVDGYRLHGVGFETMPIPAAADSALRAANGAADRATLRVGTVAGFGNDPVSTTLTFAVEESVLRSATGAGIIQSSSSGSGSGGSGSGGGGSDDHGGGSGVAWRSNSGLIAQGTTALLGTVYLTGGIRFEQNAGFLGAPRWSALPMLGMSLVGGGDRAMVKVRGAYGRGIRPARNASRESAWGHEGRSEIETLGIAPESQSGIEFGADLYLGRVLALRATRFDQTASNLIQPVLRLYTSNSGPGSGPGRSDYQLQNVGEIANSGWELEGSLARGPASLAGTFTWTSSTVQFLHPDYSGDLRLHDRVLEVPRVTASLIASWSAERWGASLAAVRAADWINYDRLALAAAIVGDTGSTTPINGAFLRGFWRQYMGATRLRVSASRELTRGLTLVVSGDNLLDAQTGEPDDITVVPGRTIRVGVRTGF